LSDIPALLYHKVAPAWEVGVTCVPPSRFVEQMRAIHSQGWRTILPGQEPQTADASPDTPQFLLAFDDGYECVRRYAFPVLQELGYRAIVFMPAGCIGKWNDWDHNLLGRRFRHLSAEMLRDLVDAGWLVGSHGIHHRALTGLHDDELQEELTLSRRRLQDLFSAEVRWCAFPFGRYDVRVLNAAAEAGYRGAVIPVRRMCPVPGGFQLWCSDSVYLWDTPNSVQNLLCRGMGYGLSAALRRQANRLSGGTIIWRKIFSAHSAATLD